MHKLILIIALAVSFSAHATDTTEDRTVLQQDYQLDTAEQEQLDAEFWAGWENG